MFTVTQNKKIRPLKPFFYAGFVNLKDVLTNTYSLIKFKTPDIYITIIEKLSFKQVAPQLMYDQLTLTTYTSLYTDLKIGGASVFSDGVNLLSGYSMRQLPEYNLDGIYIEVDVNTPIDYMIGTKHTSLAIYDMTVLVEMFGYYAIEEKGTGGNYVRNT